MKKITALLLALLMLVGVISGCGKQNDDYADKTGKADKTDKLKVVTTIFPEYDWVREIIGDKADNAEITMLLDSGVDLHSCQPSADDIVRISECDLFIYVGGESDSWVEDALKNATNKDMKVINLLDVLGDSVKTEEIVEGMQETDHDHDHDHDNEHAHDHDHDHEYNAHVWVSVSGNIDQVKNIAFQLETLNPENKDLYEANTNTYISKLENLKAEMHSELDNLPNRDIITFHEAFPYFAQEFNLNIVGVIEIEPDSEPSAKEIENIISTIKEHNIKALFTEPQYSSRVAQTIANETGASVYELDPIVTGDSNSNAYDDYINKMKENLNVLKEALK